MTDNLWGAPRRHKKTANFHRPFRRRERVMLRFRCMRSFLKFVAVHFSVCNHSNRKDICFSRASFKLIRTAALPGLRELGAAKGTVIMSHLRQFETV